jgi:hypothetical protein
MMSGSDRPRLNPTEDAMQYLLDARDQALDDGVKTHTVAYSALFMALTDLVTSYGEPAVADLTESLATRVRNGEFTVCRTRQ